jgi:hypothetical protein
LLQTWIAVDAALGGDKDNHMMLKFPSMKNGEFELEGFDKSEMDKEHANALKIAGLIFTLLDVMFQNHRSWYFGKNEKYECLVIPPSK